jgi:hypothetical protein
MVSGEQKKPRRKTNKNTPVVEVEQTAVALEQEAAVVEEEAVEQAAVEQAAVSEEAVVHTGGGEACAAGGAEPPAEPLVKIPKKRGRKPKGGKIVPNNLLTEVNKGHEPNIIMHLKCGEADLVKNNFIYSAEFDTEVPFVETFKPFDANKCNELGYSIIDYGNKDYKDKNINTIIESTKKDADNDDSRNLWNKLKELTYQLHTNSISDKKSACFWCTCDFDSPTILIPKFELNKMYHCYGCFCSPECATAYLFEEPVDTSTRFERYHLLNHIYCKIYNYEKNIKPAPNPYYTLDKYYGNLTIQEYRKLLKNERLLLIVDKPLSRILPELHEDNDDYMFNGATISTSNKFKLRRKTKQTKTDILTETFNLKGVKPASEASL